MAQIDIRPERILMRSKFYEVCAEHKAWNDISYEMRDTYARRLERSCFSAAIDSCKLDGIDRTFEEKKFVERYSTECARVLYNLSINGSVGDEYLLLAIIDGRIDPHDVAGLSSAILCPKANLAERNEIELRQKQKAPMKVSRNYTCRKCRKNETVFIDFQARSSDEASTKSIKCVHCEFVWRS